MWVTLPSPLLAVDIVAQAQTEEKLRLAPGTLFQVQGDPNGSSDRFDRQIRLCFAWAEPRHLTEGVRRLSRVLQRALN
jgi:DNA-binding transcriptional MocR family regulator